MTRDKTVDLALDFYGTRAGRLLAHLGPRVADRDGRLERQTRERVTRAQLSTCEHATLGSALVAWWMEHKFAGFTSNDYVLDLEPWQFARAVKWHDAVHVVLGTGAHTVEDELLTMGAVFGARRGSVPTYYVAIAAALLLRSGGYRRRVPALLRGAWAARAGRGVDWVGFDWEGSLDVALLDVRQMFGVPKWGIDPERLDREKHKAMRTRLDA